MSDELDDAIEGLADKPLSTTVDGRTVTERPLADQIAYDQYRKAKEAASNGNSGLKFFKTKLPGSA